MYVVNNYLIVRVFFFSQDIVVTTAQQCLPVSPLALAMIFPLNPLPPLTPQPIRQSLPSSIAANSSHCVASRSAHVPGSHQVLLC